MATMITSAAKSAATPAARAESRRAVRASVAAAPIAPRAAAFATVRAAPHSKGLKVVSTRSVRLQVGNSAPKSTGCRCSPP